MQDDFTRGGNAPIETSVETWSREAPDNRNRQRSPGDALEVGLTAVVLSVRQEQPVVLATPARISQADAAQTWHLPADRFRPGTQPSLESALRDAVANRTGRELGYLEQLLTDYAPVGVPIAPLADDTVSQLSVSYLALSRADMAPLAAGASWLDCYTLLPWEDYRAGRPDALVHHVLPGLEAWAEAAEAGPAAGCERETPMNRRERVAVSFGVGGRSFDDQRVIDRLDLIVEAGLLPAGAATTIAQGQLRLVAAGLGRLRAKIRYRPVVFELLAAEFTLFELQRTVEAVLGPTLHKQNFRRLVESTGLVEPTGDLRNNTGGRPAKTFRFRREVLLERPAPGVHVRPGRAA
jgi:hypothetical protein